MVGLTFTSCSKDEFLYDSEAEQKIWEAEYEANFIKRYGAIDPNQTWDFSTMQPTVSLPSSGASVRANTRGETDSYDVTTGNMFVDKDVIHYFLSNLPKGTTTPPKVESSRCIPPASRLPSFPFSRAVPLITGSCI